jgi:cytochrome c oxidase assembly protein subunit 15
MTDSARKYIGIWLIVGLFLVFIQVTIGGITRLTDSGLSITEWEIVKGVIPPTNEEKWLEAFQKYQTHAKKQYENLHQDMTIAEFKVIYFWEWFHRLWGRMMGLVFLFPFLFFAVKKWIPTWLYGRFAVMIGLAALAATFGWIMVASGLDAENRTWVSAYKLAIHLSIAVILFAYIFWTVLKVMKPKGKGYQNLVFKNSVLFLIGFVFLQIVFGGFMAGMRAGSLHTSWPIFINSSNYFEILLSGPEQVAGSFLFDYEDKAWVKAVVQLVHRSLAFLLLIFSLLFVINIRKSKLFELMKNASYIMLFVLAIQYLLGVLTITNIIGNNVPVVLGVLHQVVAMLLLISWLNILYNLKKNQ